MKTFVKITTTAALLNGLFCCTAVLADESEALRHDMQKEVKAHKGVFGTLFVKEKAHVEKFLDVDGCVAIKDNLDVHGNAKIHEKLEAKEVKAHKGAFGDLCVHEKAHVEEFLDVDGCVDIKDNLDVHGNAKIHENLEVNGCAVVHKNLQVDKNVHVGDDLCVADDVIVGEDLTVCGDFLLKGDIITRCSSKETVKKLHEAYKALDTEFNTTCNITPDFCYYDEKSTVIVHGPFTPDICGHLGHILQPGSAQAFGKNESSELEAHFLGSFLNDPYFPYCNCECAPKLYHHCPVVTAIINNQLINIATKIDVHYPGAQGPVVATIHGIGQYSLECCENNNHQEPMDPRQPNGAKDCKECHQDKEAKCPKVVWIHYNVSYNDCTPTCPPCFGQPT